MTHDELLAKIYTIHNDSSDPGQEATKQYNGMVQFMQALSAVVELHYPVIHALPDETCWACQDLYPCPTIKAIEKELK
jgi:hypothetical protein